MNQECACVAMRVMPTCAPSLATYAGQGDPCSSYSDTSSDLRGSGALGLGAFVGLAQVVKVQALNPNSSAPIHELCCPELEVLATG